MKNIALHLSVLWLLLAATSVTTRADTVVTTSIDEDNGLLGGGTGISLREAVKYSPNDTLITFADSLSGVTTLTRGELVIDRNLFIDASSLTNRFTVDGNNASRVFNVRSAKSLSLRGLSLTGGREFEEPTDDGFGGAIKSLGILTLDDCILINNSSPKGGAIYSIGQLTLNQCVISNNTALFGGGLVVSGGPKTITLCTVSGNVATELSGAISNDGDTLTLAKSTISGNASANDGGGISNFGRLILTQCTLAGNSAINGKGGAVINYADLTLSECTLSGNLAQVEAGGIANILTSQLTLSQTIVAGNSASTKPDISNGTMVTLTEVNLIGNLSGSGFPAGPNVIVGDPKLSPLGDFGGPTMTMHPLVGSPVIDAGNYTPGGTDQRGFSSYVDGDGNGTVRQDLGAVEAGRQFTVTTRLDDGNPGTLRNQINAAATTPGTHVVFSTTAFPETIVLNGNELFIPNASTMFIDASNLPGPVTISGNNVSRIFNIPTGATVALHSLKIINGNAGDNVGGGILNRGNCTVQFCTLTGNTAVGGGGGGGIWNLGPCVIHSSTFSGNTASYGGGISNLSICTLLSSTLRGNSASEGGGFYNKGGTSIVRSSTISDNSASDVGGGIHILFGPCTVQSSTISGNSAARGGGISNFGTLNLNSSIVAGNTGPISPNIYGSASGMYNLTSGNPQVAPLGDYGGPTLTQPPLPGSPVINAATGSTATSDQRGFAIVGIPDIGAVEYQGNPDVRRYWMLDFDGDGLPFGIEHALGTNPIVNDRSSTRNLSGPTLNDQGQVSIKFGRNPSAIPGTINILKRSTDLITYTEIFRINGNTVTNSLGTSSIVNTTDITVLDPNPPQPKAFYLLNALSP